MANVKLGTKAVGSIVKIKVNGASKDEKVKYSGEVEYSFNKKKFHSREFPINSIKLSHSYDIDRKSTRLNSSHRT